MDWPLLPQLSFLDTSRLRLPIKVLDPYNVLPPPPLLVATVFSRNFSSSGLQDDRTEGFFLSATGIREEFEAIFSKIYADKSIFKVIVLCLLRCFSYLLG